MTPDERSLLATFLRDLDGARGGPKDPEADGMIGQALARNPDAAYLLVQHAIVADQSLHAAQARIAELEAQVRPANFLPQGNGPWGQAPDRGGYSTGGSGGYATGGGSAPAGSGGYGYAPPPPDQRPGIFSGGGGLGSFLRSAGTTAAGVAGGEMLFSGLSNMFGGGGERREGFFGGGDRPEEVVVNNYGDDANDDRDGGDDSDPGNW